MEFEISDATAEELQERFCLSKKAPDREILDDYVVNLSYFFEMDGVPVGDIEVRHLLKQRRIVWNRFYPFCLHATCEEVRSQLWCSEDYIQEVGMDYLRRELCNFHKPQESLLKRGLGTLAHTLVLRSLYQNILESELHRTHYFSPGSIAPRLRKLIRRAGAEDMITGVMSLKDAQQAFTESARSIFSFKLEDL